MTNAVSFFVPSKPCGQGNHRTGSHGKAYETTKGHSAWRAGVTWMAKSAMRGKDPLPGPIRLTVQFNMPRGKSVKREHHTVPPDLSKLVRAVEDSITVKGGGGCIRDDAEITRLVAGKDYADGAVVGARVTIERACLCDGT